MAKTVQLDDVAYARLKSARRDDETWSDVVKRFIRPKPSVQQVLDAIDEAAKSISPETLDIMDETVTRRRRQPRRKRA